MNELNETQHVNNPIDIKIKLSALWVAVLFIFAYVDIFALFRAEHLEGLLAGEIVGTPFEVNQGFLIFTTLYILPACLMVFFSVTLAPRINRRVNIIVASLYAITIAISCIGEEWIFYLLGSAVEVILLIVLIRLAVRWPSAQSGVRS